MNITVQLANHFRQVNFGGNWTWVNLKETLADVDWQQANQKIGSLNTIIQLTYHINYYVVAVTNVLRGNPMDAHDKYAFDHPPIQSQEDWEKFREKVFTDAETFATLIEQLPERKMDEIFVQEKYGTYFRNFQGIIEHTHYHLGQIVFLKKMILSNFKE